MQDLRKPRRIETPFTLQTTVNITHNFAAYPIVQLIDATGAVFYPENVVNNTVNDLTITMSSATTGTAILIA